MFALAYENSKSNIKNLKYIADTYDDLATIPAEELSFGALCKVIETGDIYKLNSDGEWIRQLNGQGGGNGSGLPALGEYDTGSVLVSVDGEWKVFNTDSDPAPLEIWYRLNIDSSDSGETLIDEEISFPQSEEDAASYYITINDVLLYYAYSDEHGYYFYSNDDTFGLSFIFDDGIYFYVYDSEEDKYIQEECNICIGYKNYKSPSYFLLPLVTSEDEGKTIVVDGNGGWQLFPLSSSNEFSQEEMAYNADCFVRALINDTSTTSTLLASNNNAVTCYLYEPEPTIVV